MAKKVFVEVSGPCRVKAPGFGYIIFAAAGKYPLTEKAAKGVVEHVPDDRKIKIAEEVTKKVEPPKPAGMGSIFGGGRDD